MFKLNPLFISVAIGMLATATCISGKANGFESTNNKTDIEVIDVYAQKRAQSIVDVAVAVTVIDGSSLERSQIKDTTQLTSLVPNLKITNNAGEGTPPAFNIRGIGMIDYNTSTVSPISIYSDGIVSGSANNLSVNLFDIEQVEVLRGPQGTLFGRNTTGGAILVRSKQPDTELGGYVNASVGEYHWRSVDGAVNIPLSDTTAMRFAFNQDDYNFSTNNLMAGSPNGGLKQQNFRLMLKTEFDSITILTKLHQDDWSGKPKPIASNGVLKRDGSGMCSPEQLGSDNCVDAFGMTVGGTNYWDVRADTADRSHKTDSWGASVNVLWDINQQVDLTLISGVRHLDREHSWDSDGSGNYIEGSMDTNNRLVSHELNIAYQHQYFFWQTGIFYLSERINQNNTFDLFRDFRLVPSLAANAVEFLYDNNLENSSMALYSQLDYPLRQATTLTAGLRYTDESTRYHANADIDTLYGVIADVWDLNGKVEDGEWSGKLALTHKLTHTSSIYASFTRGYKSGGYNAGYSTNLSQAQDSEYQAEKLNAYEVGGKLGNLMTDLQLNIAAFYYDYQDQQVFVNVPDNVVPYHVLKNAGDSTIYGAEVEMYYTPTNNLQFNFNVGYLPKANIGRYQKHNISVDDNRLPFSSKWNISGVVVHETQLAGKRLTSQLSFDYQSDFFFDQNENIYTEHKGYTLVNGQISYQASNALLLSVWGKNITNTEYAELRFDSIAALAAVTELKGEARQLGVGLHYSF
ncbi:TonB-dependent receptor [Thalassotalea piscium]|uniref:Iron complex outermembrane receptor protein n=1 Tax=Thalassotalea piscium TaxID=1230533 RepID=A0A7X0NEV6_9GAMM|nr:TonB-dependent receptor [Thalassotalea piscium]MBB6542078.1 iron complex outermembrane receptor protein [Thalassotalea piscium]